MTNTPSPTDEELIERGRRMAKAMYQYEPDHAPAQLVDKIIDRLESRLADIAKLEEIVAVANELVNGGLQLRSGNVPRLTVVETSDKSDPHYRLCTLLDALNRSTDRA